jgi:hypothetical protein
VLLSARRWVCVVVGVVVGVLVFASASAFAVAPEAPGSVTVEHVGATRVTLRGVLSPGGEGHPGTYEFLYKESKMGPGCEGAGKAPESPGLALGFEHEEVSQELAGLSPETEYTVCLSERNPKGEETVGLLATFETIAVLEAPIAAPISSASDVTSSSVKLQGVLNPGKPGEPGSYEFLYQQSATECAHENPGTHQLESEGRTSTTGTLGGEKEGVGPTEVGGLSPNIHYTYCLLVRNEAGETALSSPVTFTTESRKPSVSGVSFSNVGSTTATIDAQVEPGGLETTLTVQYGTGSSYGLESSPEKVPATGGTTVVQLSGLQPDSEYHFRVVALNADGEVGSGAGLTFTTLNAMGPGLPDGRVYEMVTSPQNEGAEAYIPWAIQPEYLGEGFRTQRLFDVAPDGDHLVYEADPTHNGGGESAGNGLGSAYLATHSATGWTQTSIQPAGRRVTQYHGFSSDMSKGVLTSESERPEYEVPQLPGDQIPRGRYGEIYSHVLDEEIYQPLFSALPINNGKRQLWADNGYTRNQLPEGNEPLFAGSSEDFGQLLFQANEGLLDGEGGLEKELTEDVKREIVNKEEFDYLYDSSKGQPRLVDVLPDGKVAPDATFGAPEEDLANRRYNPPNFSHVVSSDGSRIFWSTLEVDGGVPNGSYVGELNLVPSAVYVRENALQPQSPLNDKGECAVATDACTIQIDKEVGGGGRFWTASSDGSKAFFTKGALYEYDVNTGVTSDLTPGVGVQAVIGASEDGDYIYYVDSNDQLYMLHEGRSEWEAPILIATLSREDGIGTAPFNGLYKYGYSPNLGDGGEGEVGDWVADLGQRTAEVTPDGHSLVFMSNQSLNAKGFAGGYPNEGAEEVYVYQAVDHRLFCASCSPTGEPPPYNASSAAAFLPVSWSDTHMPTWISEDGNRVFFDSFEPLVPQDTNGDQVDVYEWEREGTGSCQAGDGASGGCVYLLSAGSSSVGSYLIGASADGSDVFMITRSHLTPEDENEYFDVYDARVDGAKPVSPPACTGTGCQGVPAPPPTFATPSSVTFDGVGNFPISAPSKLVVKGKSKTLTRAEKLARALRACRGKPKRKQSSCERAARRKYGASDSKKASKSAKGSR